MPTVIQYITNLATPILALIGFIYGYASLRAEVRGMKEKSVERDKLIKELEDTINSHIVAFDRHVDPRRDEERWDSMIARLERIERKLDGMNGRGH